MRGHFEWVKFVWSLESVAGFHALSYIRWYFNIIYQSQRELEFRLFLVLLFLWHKLRQRYNVSGSTFIGRHLLSLTQKRDFDVGKIYF